MTWEPLSRAPEAVGAPVATGTVGSQSRLVNLRRLVSALCVAFFALTIMTLPAEAQTEQEAEELEELKAERERIRAEKAAQAVQVNAATADFNEVAQALDDINALVDLQEARLADAEQAVRSAQAQLRNAEARQAEIETEVTGLQGEVRQLAVASFTGETGANGEDFTSLLLSDDPTEAARRRSLVQFQTGSLGDGVDRLRSLVAEAEVVSTQRQEASEAATAGQAEAEQRRVELIASQDAQLELVEAVELRLEARLAEAAVLAERDEAAAALVRQQEEAIAQRIRQEAAREAAIAAAAERSQRPPVATPAEISTVRGIQVHQSIAGTVEDLLASAAADGVDLSGWGWRDNIKQIQLRQAHCGTSEYDVWEKPASLCNPPTARPGQSQHERGLAIDFTYRGGSITTRSNPGFVWLNNNAHRWGFVNLPSEPWHWSTTGR